MSTQQIGTPFATMPSAPASMMPVPLGAPLGAPLGMPGMPGMPQSEKKDFVETLAVNIETKILEEVKNQMQTQIYEFAALICGMPEAQQRGITPAHIIEIWNSVAGPHLTLATTAPVKSTKASTKGSGNQCAATLVKGNKPGSQCGNPAKAGSAYCARHAKQHDAPTISGSAIGLPGVPPPMGVPQGLPPPMGVPQLGVPQGLPPPMGVPQLGVPPPMGVPQMSAPAMAQPSGGCSVPLKSGSRAGQLCGGKVVAGCTYCSRHKPKDAAPAANVIPPGVPMSNLGAFAQPQMQMLPPQFPSGIPQLQIPPQMQLPSQLPQQLPSQPQ